MSCPSKRMRPSSGAISPASWPISVVLPAPFGPITACSSPRLIASMMASEAMTPPKRLVSPSICSSASATAHAFQQAVHAAAREQHDQQEQRAEHDLPILARPHGKVVTHERERNKPNEHRQ